MQRWARLFAETANVAYRLSFADQGKQTSVFRLPRIIPSCSSLGRQKVKRTFLCLIIFLLIGLKIRQQYRSLGTHL